jgi:signal transduction histidine kinase
MTFMRNALLIYKEALHNVVKHARARHVAIEVADDHGLFALRIRDDGVGFAEPEVRPGHGLENMRRRAHLAGGRIAIVSATDQGTQVRFSARMA